MDVEFSVEVVKKQEWPHSSIMRPSTVVGEFEQGWPRIETADYLMAVGSAASLQEALQLATLELHHWLDDDFGLSEKAVSLLDRPVDRVRGRRVVGPNTTRSSRRVRKAYLPQPAGALQTLTQ